MCNMLCVSSLTNEALMVMLNKFSVTVGRLLNRDFDGLHNYVSVFVTII